MVEHKTLSIRAEVYNRLESLKPYDSLSFSEFLAELANHYEAEVTLDD